MQNRVPSYEWKWVLHNQLRYPPHCQRFRAAPGAADNTRPPVAGHIRNHRFLFLLAITGQKRGFEPRGIAPLSISFLLIALPLSYPFQGEESNLRHINPKWAGCAYPARPAFRYTAKAILSGAARRELRPRRRRIEKRGKYIKASASIPKLKSMYKPYGEY